MTDTEQTIDGHTHGTREVSGEETSHPQYAPGSVGRVGPTSEGDGAREVEGEARDDDDARASDDGSEVEGDLDALVATAAQRDEYLALAQRTQADFENYRKRVARESAAAQRRGVAKLAKELLPALDNLDRALEEAQGGAGAGRSDPLLEGVRLVRSELGSALARVGIESFSPEGEQFDPAEHEAMAQQPVEGVQSGTVVEVYQPGYRCDGTIIRPARVVVAA
jgi:molecular chaperone GrpE